MAYNRKFLSLIGMDGTAQRARLWLYDGGTNAASDTLAEITTDDYLVDDPVVLTVGDVILFRGSSNDVALRRVTAATTATVTTRAIVGESLQATATWNPGSLVDGAGETSASFAVVGAAFGDTVSVAAPYDLQGILCVGYVDAADSVKVRLQNETGGTIDLASGSWKVFVAKR